MTDRSKREIVDAITALLTELIEQDERSIKQAELKKENEPVEMLTVKECVSEVREWYTLTRI